MACHRGGAVVAGQEAADQAVEAAKQTGEWLNGCQSRSAGGTERMAMRGGERRCTSNS
jgi:hypothetical protein